MKSLFLLGVLLALPLAGRAADTAYSALRVYGKKEGEQALHRVVEVRGSKGAPQPATWKLVVDDPAARGGVREIDVQNGRIVGQRMPTGRDSGAVMNFNQLNLDSDGAFTIVNQEAEKRGVTFDRLDYVLRSSGAAGAAPVWEIDLYEGRAGKVASMRIAADSGDVLDRNFAAHRYAEDRAYLEEGDRRGPSHDRRPGETVDERAPAEEVGAFMNRIGRHFQKRGRQLENFFRGRD
ncbi:MAG: hypothetical protein QOE70_3241 [Chthoniobacter sp.]|jgi:hypothetical protein|nr:hypothetical protein [Chthoniobacter sp.]